MYLSDKQVAERYGVSRVTIWRWVRKPAGKDTTPFPHPITLSPGCVRWKASDVENWEARAEAKSTEAASHG
jgi:predicted DNA-binding transcriptional regulator AlpA